EATDWASRRPTVVTWLQTNPVRAPIIRALLGNAQESVVTRWLTFLSDELPQMMDRAMQNPEIVGTGLAERLAEAAILPMYGMPSRTRVLYHGAAIHGGLPRTGEAASIDRDIELAIIEFAPGA